MPSVMYDISDLVNMCHASVVSESQKFMRILVMLYRI